MRVFAFAVLGLSLGLAACAPSADGADGRVATNVRQCFNIPQVTSFRQGEPNQVFLRVGRSEIYELDTIACLDLDFATRLTLAPDTAGLVGSRLCTGDWARIVVPGSLSPNAACRVRVVRKLTDEQVAALPAAHVP